MTNPMLLPTPPEDAINAVLVLMKGKNRLLSQRQQARNIAAAVAEVERARIVEALSKHYRENMVCSDFKDAIDLIRSMEVSRV